MLAVARANCQGRPEICFVEADAGALPFAAASFDIVLCQGTFHHFAPALAVAFLAEARRVCRGAIFVTDLRRSPLLYAGAWLLLNLVVSNRITRHDGLSSIRRAYLPGEMLELAREAGLTGAKMKTTLRFRQSLSWELEG